MRVRAALPMCLAACLAACLAMAATARADDAPSPAPTASAAPSPVEVHGSVEKGALTIGQRFRYTIGVAAPTGVEILLAQPTERLDDFEIVDFGDTPALERNGKIVITRWFQLVG